MLLFTKQIISGNTLANNVFGRLNICKYLKVNLVDLLHFTGGRSHHARHSEKCFRFIYLGGYVILDKNKFKRVTITRLDLNHWEPKWDSTTSAWQDLEMRFLSSFIKKPKSLITHSLILGLPLTKYNAPSLLSHCVTFRRKCISVLYFQWPLNWYNKKQVALEENLKLSIFILSKSERIYKTAKSRSTESQVGQFSGAIKQEIFYSESEEKPQLE